jgi:HAD domain in Swiss Army Knife RNA repair proteins
MKIIFLDIDGVLKNRAFPHGNSADPVCVSLLNQIVEKTNAYFVISSSWRTGSSLSVLKDMLDAWGVVPGRLIDKTPCFKWECKRGDEIQAWLAAREEQRGDVEKFIILDDDTDMIHLLPHLVKTTFQFGLTEETASIAIQKLNP